LAAGGAAGCAAAGVAADCLAAGGAADCLAAGVATDCVVSDAAGCDAAGVACFPVCAIENGAATASAKIVIPARAKLILISSSLWSSRPKTIARVHNYIRMRVSIPTACVWQYSSARSSSLREVMPRPHAKATIL
jgi:hypothetical protein